MQPLHVDEEMPVGDAERMARRGLGIFVVPGELRRRPVDRRSACFGASRPSSRARASSRRCRRSPHDAAWYARVKRSGPNRLGAIVPDLRAIERRTTGLPRRRASRTRELGKQAVAVDVHDVGARRWRGSSARRMRRPRAAHRAERARSRQLPLRRGIQVTGPGERRAAPPARGGCATYSTVVAGLARPHAELPRQQRVGRLVRRQVGRDVEDVHRLTLSLDRRLHVASAGTRRTSPASHRAPAWRTRGTARADRRTRRAPPASGCTGSRRRSLRSNGTAG